jgi:hypothetical protein
MNENTNAVGMPGGCIFCGTVMPMLEQMWAKATGDHFRNAGVEFLKGVRSLIDLQISCLSKHEAKGTHVAVE